MEWVETTGKSLDEAKDEALDRLGIGADDAEFEVLEEPRSGLFGRTRGVARVRARVRPAAVRPKQDRRGRRRGDGREARSEAKPGSSDGMAEVASVTVDGEAEGRSSGQDEQRSPAAGRTDGPRSAPRQAPATSDAPLGDSNGAGETMSNHEQGEGPHDVDAGQVEQVRAAAVSFSDGLLRAFGLDGTSSATVEGNEIEVRIDGTAGAGGETSNGLGLLIGPGGRTLLAIQDLARVAAQRRLGDHDTRLRIDVAGYREKRKVALERFARNVAEMVKESGIARSLDPMPSADRKVIHDALTSIAGVTSRSEGDDPHRRIIVSPA